MNKFLLTFALSFIISFCLEAQDTIKLEPSVVYSSYDYPFKDQTFYEMVLKNKKGKEVIVYTQNHVKFESCYYYDKDRVCLETTENHILSDSVISVDSALWRYTHDEYNIYKVQHFKKDYYILGKVNELIPFSKKGVFAAVNLKGDTLWKRDYDSRRKELELPKTIIKGKVYESFKLTKQASFNSDSLLPELNIKYDEPLCCDGDPPYYVFINFTITKEGKIINLNTGSATETEAKEIALAISKLKNIKPGEKNGKPVHSSFHATIELIYD